MQAFWEPQQGWGGGAVEGVLGALMRVWGRKHSSLLKKNQSRHVTL